jgi:hypothetical protein
MLSSMGARTNAENRKLNVPAPGAYDLPSKIVEGPAPSMGLKLQNQSLEGKLGPGPGGYTYDKQKVGNVSFS